MTGSAVSTLAAFVAPALLGMGAAAMSVPILIHLLARRRFKRIRWAAMDFLIDAERRNRRRIRMEEWILLALRCLAIFLLGLMVARPFLSPADVSAAWGGARQTERVFVLDDSFSMGYASPDGTPFARAKEAVRRLVSRVREDSPDDTVTILRMTAVDQPVAAGVFLDDTQWEQLLERLEGLTISERGIDLPGVFSGIADYLSRDTDILSAAVYVISDFQRTDWAQRGASSSGARFGPALSEALEAWAVDDRGLSVTLVNVGEKDAGNTAVIGLSLRGGQVVAGTTGIVEAQVANHAAQIRDRLSLRVSVGGRPQAAKNLGPLDEHQDVSVGMELEFLRVGDEAVRVELPEDGLAIDNTRFLSAPVVGAVRVLVVNGEPSADPYDDEVSLLATALRPEGEVFSGYEAVIVDEAELDTLGLSDFHAVILANVYRISEPAMESLERFVRRGGGVMFFLGDQVDAELFNAAFFRAGEGLSPVRLTEVTRPGDPVHLVIVDRLHVALRGVSRQDDPIGIGRIPFYAFFGCQPAEDAAEGSTDQEGLQTTGRGVNVIARFDDAEESPAIVERRFGEGRVVLLASSADKEWNLWPDHPTFLPVILELIHHVAAGAEQPAEHRVGSPIDLPLDAGVFEPDAIVRSPAYPNEPEAFVTATPSDDGRGLVVHWEHTERSGLYQFVLRRREGGERVRLVAVNVDPHESDLTMARRSELNSAMGRLPFDYVEGLAGLLPGGDEARMELWRLVVVLALVVLMVEQGLAWWWGQRR